jgi:predicted HicB family RNase H-like nuclease|nr:MAG TPA: HicB family [Caudoviricetes sp.]
MFVLLYDCKEVKILPEKTLAFRIDEEFHRKIKIHLAKEGITLRDYVLGLIRDDLEKLEKEDSTERK